MMKSALPTQIRCREINETDTDEIVNLLTRGFYIHRRSQAFWVKVLRRLSEHRTPPGFPKYGYLLESDGTVVGVILLIFSSVRMNGETMIRCNVSSWYVEPTFRSYAALLTLQALKRKQVTYYNLTPMAHTLPILNAQGFTLYCRGRFVAVPALCGPWYGARVTAVAPGLRPAEDLEASEIEILTDHANFGCISLICTSGDRRYPFVFAPRWKFGGLPVVILIYSRNLEDFIRFAGPVGRFLARRGFPLVILDSNGPVPGLIGTYFDNRPKYFKGPAQPRLGDVAYSEIAMFGV